MLISSNRSQLSQGRLKDGSGNAHGHSRNYTPSKSAFVARSGGNSTNKGGSVRDIEIRRTQIYSENGNVTKNPWDVESYDRPEDILLPGNYDLGIPREHMEALRAVLDRVDPDDEDEEDEDQAHPLADIMFRYWGTEPNPRDKLLQLAEKVQEESKKTDDLGEICKNLGLPAPLTVKHDLAVAMLREMFGRRPPPKGYFESFLDEFGLTGLKEYFFPLKPKKSQSKWRFGIELKDPNREIQPLSENALRGYVGVPYYDHLEELSRIHPENARRILTVIHRIYTPPILYVDLHPDKEPTDQQLYNDSENLKKAQCDIFKKFIDTYPDLKWPVDDEGFLDIYNKWYPEDKAEEVNSLPEIMKQSYGSGRRLSAPNFHYRFIAVPAVSCAAALATGSLLQRGISALAGMVGGINGQMMVENYVGSKLCGAVVGLLTWAGMTGDLSVKGDVFSVALKNFIENGLEDPRELMSAVYSGLIPKDEVKRGIEKFVVHCTLTAFQRAMRLANDSKGIDAWNLLTKQVRKVAEVCLPICGASVYRIMYFVAGDLAVSDDLPAAHGYEVLGSEISGDKEDPYDDYSRLYQEGREMVGLPEPNRELYERNAMLFTTFCLQAFGNMKGFKRVSDEPINKYEDFKREMKERNIPDEDWDNLKDEPMMPSTLDDVEKFASELEETNGKFKRITLEREYGFDPLNEFMGETEEQKTTRMQIELQEARDALVDISRPQGYKLEMAKAISIFMYLREEWLLPRYTAFLKKQCTEFIASEIENHAGNIDEKIKEFDVAPKYTEEIKTDAMFLLAQRLYKDGKLDHDKVLDMARATGIADQVALDACSVALFQDLKKEVEEWDLTAVTSDMIKGIKQRYRCKDLVFVNAICEVIKQSVSQAKKEMINARNKLNWNLVEKHMSMLLKGRKAVVNAAASTIDCKLWYRLEQAFRYNLPFAEHEFTKDEIIGTGIIAKLPNQDWQLADPPPKKSELQIAKEEFEADLKDAEPLEIVGEDNETPLHLQMKLSELVEKGEIDPQFECIPTEFHVGDRPKEPEYELEELKPVDEFADGRPIINSKLAYACWVVYCYRKRGVNDEDAKTVLTIFPFLEKLMERTDRDWRRLYARQRLRQKDSLGSKVDWEEELDCDKATAAEICSVTYEENLLKRTGAFVEHIEDDIGDVQDSYFNPFDPSIYNRMNYLYSEKIPSDLEMENIKKLHSFFKLSPEKIEEIHTKCFSFALDQHCGQLMKESVKDWSKVVEEQVKPLAKQLLISDEPLDMILRKAEYDYLTREANRLMMDRVPGKDFLERAEFIVSEFKRLNVLTASDGKLKQKFSIKAQTSVFMEEIMSAFIISHCDLYEKVDQTKLDEMCAVYGLFREDRKELLNKLGRKFYHKFLKQFKEEELTMDCMKEVKHLQKTYEFENVDLEKVFATHVAHRIKEWYDPESGLEAMKKLVIILHGEDFRKIIPFERSRRIHWFINIIKDCIEDGEDKAETRVFTYTPDEFFELQFKGGEENFDNLQGVINTSSRILTLSPEEYREARIIAAEEHGAIYLETVLHLLKGKDGIYAADQAMSKFIRALSIAPSDALPVIKKELPKINDYEVLRKVVMMLPCSDATLAKGIKLIDSLEKA